MALMGGVVAFGRPAPSRQDGGSLAGTVEGYFKSLARAGGYGWADQEEADLAVTCAAVETLALLGRPAPDAARVAAFIRTAHPQRDRRPEYPLRMFDLMQIRALRRLGAEVAGFGARAAPWVRPIVYPKQYEPAGNPPLPQEVAALLCRAELGLPMEEAAEAWGDYLADRRRPSGSFNHTLASAGGDGHVVPTYWALQALQAVGRATGQAGATVAWLQACQRSDGGFSWQPKPDLAGESDVLYTWAAVQALRLLKSRPSDPEACVRWLRSLWNADGGFGDRPGWSSNPLATECAVAALHALDALAPPPARTAASPAATEVEVPAARRVWTIQLEAHGCGSPWEAVDLARALRIHLWGAKNAKPGWIACAQGIADRLKVPVAFCVANEEYGVSVGLPGLGTYTHVSDLFAPAGVEFGPHLGSESALSWEAFRTRRLAPLEKARGRLFWQFGENEEFVRVLLDDSAARGGYAAISTFHFGNADFTRSQPFLMRYRGRLPYVALQDAHGVESWWWSDQLTGFRTLFIAEQPTWEGWLEALRRDWVVAVRRDAATDGRLRMHGGTPAARTFVRTREADWRWWGERPEEDRRPLVSIVPVTPADSFEEGCPERGMNLRVRTAWRNTTQGQPKEPLVELMRLRVDDALDLSGAALEERLVQRSGARGGWRDVFHLLPLPALAAGPHRAVATLREIAGGREAERALTFEVTES